MPVKYRNGRLELQSLRALPSLGVMRITASARISGQLTSILSDQKSFIRAEQAATARRAASSSMQSSLTHRQSRRPGWPSLCPPSPAAASPVSGWAQWLCVGGWHGHIGPHPSLSPSPVCHATLLPYPVKHASTSSPQPELWASSVSIMPNVVDASVVWAASGRVCPVLTDHCLSCDLPRPRNKGAQCLQLLSTLGFHAKKMGT